MPTLLDAVFYRKYDEINRLIGEADNMDTEVDRDGRTPLINAAAMKENDVARLLLEHGADVNFQDSVGYSSLHFASRDHNLELMMLLIDYDTDIELRDDWGNTSLSNAVYYRTPQRLEAIRLLLDHGADPDLKNNYGVSPRSLSESSPDLPVDWKALGA